jgi:Na+-translocating ferredoxin:NAD+ oxidoreductase RnfE subunit
MEVKINFNIDILFIVLIIANVTILYLTIVWYKKAKKVEAIIAIIAAIVAIITLLGNSYNESVQKRELSKILNDQVAMLTQRIDSLNRKNSILNAKSDSLYSIVQNSGVASVTGNDNNTAIGTGNIAGNQNTVISGNDHSVITITPKERPAIDERISVSQYKRTQIHLRVGDKVLIQATGTISAGANIGPSGPEGKISGGLFGFPLTQYNIVKEYPHAALMFKYADVNAWVNCGREYNFTADRDGFLIFEVNDNEKENNEGTYQVDIKVYR